MPLPKPKETPRCLQLAPVKPEIPLDTFDRPPPRADKDVERMENLVKDAYFQTQFSKNGADYQNIRPSEIVNVGKCYAKGKLPAEDKDEAAR
jgi:hypothetical protein